MLSDTINSSISKGGFTNFFKDKIKKELNAHIENEVYGLKVYRLNSGERIEDILFTCTSSVLTKLVEVPKLSDDFILKDELLIAYSCLNSSNILQDIRLKFILKITALESLVKEKQRKNSEHISIINRLNKMITVESLFENSNEENSKTVNQIKTKIGEMKNKSVLEKCLAIIEKAKLDSLYNNEDCLVFFKKCYDIRSIYLHQGNYDISKMSTFLDPLDKLVLDVLEAINNE